MHCVRQTHYRETNIHTPVYKHRDREGERQGDRGAGRLENNREYILLALNPVPYVFIPTIYSGERRSRRRRRRRGRGRGNLTVSL